LESENASEKERLVQKIRDVIREHDEFEKDLRRLEAEAGLPTFDQSRSWSTWLPSA